jgi:GTP cyclohydrolase IB
MMKLAALQDNVEQSHVSVELPDPIQNPAVLEDVQGRSDERNIALQYAGVSQVEMPLTIEIAPQQFERVAVNASMAVSLSPEEKGTHMSRFIVQMNEWSQQNKPLPVRMQAFSDELATRLDAPDVSVSMAFKPFLEKAAPVTAQVATMPYGCELRAEKRGAITTCFATVQVPIATLCPCSKAISDFGAHNQRAIVTIETRLAETGDVTLPQLIECADLAASCPVYPLLKRADEKWVTERQYTNPKFVEDVARDLVLMLRQMEGVAGFRIRVEALESIHAHNAWAGHEEHFTV